MIYNGMITFCCYLVNGNYYTTGVIGSEMLQYLNEIHTICFHHYDLRNYLTLMTYAEVIQTCLMNAR
jgi:hypothetical protein